ncbi:MAG: phage holin family protein [Peptoniphilaceae bacterium]
MIKLLLKIFVSAIAIALAALLSPMKVSNFSAAVVTAIVIGLLDWAVLRFTNIDNSRAGRGSVGFLTTAIILYLAGVLVDGFSTGLIGALIGAFVLGIVDMIIPGEKTFKV